MSLSQSRDAQILEIMNTIQCNFGGCKMGGFEVIEVRF